MGDFVTHAGLARCSLKTRVRSCDIRAFFFLSCARMLKTENVLSGLVIGRFVSCREAGKRMLAAGRGSIINIGSLASISALGRRHLSYSMAMGAVVQMTRELSTEWSGRGVRVNAILPAQVINPGLTRRM